MTYVHMEYCSKCGKETSFHDTKCSLCKQKEKEKREMHWRMNTTEGRIEELKKRIEELETRLGCTGL